MPAVHWVGSCVPCGCVSRADEFTCDIDENGNVSMQGTGLVIIGRVALSRRQGVLFFAAMNGSGEAKSIELDTTDISREALKRVIDVGYGQIVDEARELCAEHQSKTADDIMAIVLERYRKNGYTFDWPCDPCAAITAGALSGAFCPFCFSKGGFLEHIAAWGNIKYCGTGECMGGGTITGEKSSLPMASSLLEHQVDDYRRLKLPKVSTPKQALAARKNKRKAKSKTKNVQKKQKKKEAEVVAIVDKRVTSALTEYKVKWGGADDEGKPHPDDWISAELLGNCASLVRQHDRSVAGCRTEGCEETPTLSCPHHSKECGDVSCAGVNCIGVCSSMICASCAKAESVTCEVHVDSCEVCLSRGNRHGDGNEIRITCSAASCGKTAIGDCCASARTPTVASLVRDGEEGRVSDMCTRCGPCVYCRRPVDKESAEVRCVTCGRRSHFACDPFAAVVHGFGNDKYECSACTRKCMVCYAEAAPASICDNCEGIACNDCDDGTFEDDVCAMCCLGMRSEAAFTRRKKLEKMVAKALAEKNAETKKKLCVASSTAMKILLSPE